MASDFLFLFCLFFVVIFFHHRNKQASREKQSSSCGGPGAFVCDNVNSRLKKLIKTQQRKGLRCCWVAFFYDLFFLLLFLLLLWNFVFKRRALSLGRRAKLFLHHIVTIIV